MVAFIEKEGLEKAEEIDTKVWGYESLAPTPTVGLSLILGNANAPSCPVGNGRQRVCSEARRALLSASVWV
jgi:hypothetical protein